MLKVLAYTNIEPESYQHVVGVEIDFPPEAVSPL